MKQLFKIVDCGLRIALILPIMAWTIGCQKDKQANDNAPHPRIISHSPAITQIIFDLGLGDHLVGVTNWCDLPADEKYANISRIGDAHGIRTEMAILARPDIIFTQDDPSERGRFNNVLQYMPDVKIVYMSIESLDDIFQAVEKIGQSTDRKVAAEKLTKKMREKLETLKPRNNSSPPAKKLRVLFSSSHQSPMVAGNGTYIADFFALAGAENAGEDIPGKMLWRKSKVENIIVARPDVLIIFAIAGQEDQVRNFWLSKKDIPAAKTGRVFVVTDARWLRPNAQFIELAEELRKMLDADISK